MSYLDVPIRRISNINNSYKVIEGNPPYCSRVKVPTLLGNWGYQNLLEKSSLVSYCQVRNQYKYRASLSIYHKVTHTQLQHMSEREGVGIRERTTGGDHLLCLWVLLLPLVLILSLRKLRGFLLYVFPEENICFYCLL